MESNTALVNLSGGGPYGFRLMEGPTDLLVVDKVKTEGKAMTSGLKEGDRLLELNGKDCRGLGVEQINSLIESAGQNLVLKVDRSRGSHTTDAGMTVTVPHGVQVQHHADQSITMTIGVPFDLDSALAGSQQRALSAAGKQDTSMNRHESTQKTNQSKPPQKVQATPSSPETPGGASGKKKLYMDSMFYDDPTHKYPTVEEQITLARQVALNFLDPTNINSRGYKLFVKKMKRAAKYTTGATEEEIAAANAVDPDEPTTEFNALRPRPAGNGDVGGLPASIVFAPKLPTSGDKERLDAMSMEEIERMELSKTKLTHTNVNPQLCFSLADDLKNMKGKGGRLFAQRQAKAESWCIGDTDDHPEEIKPSGEVMHKFTSQWKQEENQNSNPPVNQLKDLTDAGQAPPRGKISKDLTQNLEATLVVLRRDQAGRNTSDAQQKSASVDPERLKALGHHPIDIGRAYGSKRPMQPLNENTGAEPATSNTTGSNPRPATSQTGSLPAT